MEKEARIYVAGHTGLVGSAIFRKLKDRGYVNLLTASHSDLDLTRQDVTEAFFKKYDIEYVFLAAAKVGGILANNTYRADFINQNALMALNVINAAYRNGVKKLLNLGSSCIYPKFAEQPLKERHLLTGELEPTNEPYAIAKIFAIKLCRYFNEQYGTNYLSVMPTNLYGPNDNFHLLNSHALPALLRKFYLQRLLSENKIDSIRKDLDYWNRGINYKDYSDEKIAELLSSHLIDNKRVGIWGTGKPFREFLFVDDLADACVFIMDKYDYSDIGELVNIGTGEDIRISELAFLIKDIVGSDAEIVYDTSKPDGTPRKLLDVTKLGRLGWRAKVSLREGIEKTYSWYLNTVY